MENALCGRIDGAALALGLDDDPEYSHCADGFVQACFFAYDAAEQNYLEFYLLLPQDAAAGETFRNDLASPCSLSLYEVSKDSEALYFSGASYPGGSEFDLRIDHAQTSASALTLRGTLNGRLGRIENDQPTGEFLTLSNLRFDFTLPLRANRCV